MKASGLSSAHGSLQEKSVYFIDSIASGSGPHYVIEEMVRDFKKAQIKLPNINLINIAQIELDNEYKERNKLVAKENVMDGGQTKPPQRSLARFSTV